MVLSVDIESLRTRKLRKQVGQKTFTRGCQYFASGRVIDARRDAESVVGTVTGSGREDYMTRIRLSRKDGRLIEAECTCPQEHGYCKHMVALALTALADPTLRSAESAGWGRILDHAADVASEFGDVSDNHDRLAVRLGLPLNPDDAVRVRLFKCRLDDGMEIIRAFSADEVRRALFEDSDVLGLKRPNDVIAARVAGLLEPYDEEELLADESNLDLLLRALSRVEHVFMGNSEKRLNIRLDAVRPRVRAAALHFDLEPGAREAVH